MVVNNKVDSLSYDVEAPPAQAPTTPAVVSAPPTPRGEAAAAPAMTTTATAVELHKVSVPERRSTAKALRQRLAEVFFPDDPLHQFKNQSSARRLVLALQYFFPIFHWGSDYSLRLLRSDVVSGLTIASLAIPQARTRNLITHTRHCFASPEILHFQFQFEFRHVLLSLQGISYAKLANLPPIIGLCK